MNDTLVRHRRGRGITAVNRQSVVRDGGGVLFDHYRYPDFLSLN